MLYMRFSARIVVYVSDLRMPLSQLNTTHICVVRFFPKVSKVQCIMFSRVMGRPLGDRFALIS